MCTVYVDLMNVATRACLFRGQELKIHHELSRGTSSKPETLNQCWFNVGPASKTVGQHQTNIGSTSNACCRYDKLSNVVQWWVNG